jgi:hypothetical protein
MRFWLKRSRPTNLILEKKKSLVKGDDRRREAARLHRLTGWDDSTTVAASFI